MAKTKELKSFKIMDWYRGDPYKVTIHVSKTTFDNNSIPKYLFDLEHPRQGHLIEISVRARSLKVAKKKFENKMHY